MGSVNSIDPLLYQELQFNPDTKLVLPEGFELDNETTQRFSTFLMAISNISQSYYKYDDIVDGLKKEHLERVFAYELYHQWSLLIDKDYIINGEIGKRLMYFDSQSGKLKDKNDKYPDLVLHRGQSYHDGNMIVCEIKRKENNSEKEYIRDLFKLAIFTNNKTNHNNNNYQCGIFVYVRGLQEDFMSLIDKNETDLQTLYNEYNTKKIICVFCDENCIKYNSFYNILEILKSDQKIKL